MACANFKVQDLRLRASNGAGFRPKRVFSFFFEGFPFEGRRSVLFAWYVDSALCCPSSVSSASNPEH